MDKQELQSEQTQSEKKEKKEEKRKQWVIFKKDGYELQPLQCESELTYDENDYCIIHKKIITVDIFKIDLYITYKKKGKNENEHWEFVRGFLYKNKNEYKITYFSTFSSLQRGAFCYDKIGICEYSEK